MGEKMKDAQLEEFKRIYPTLNVHSRDLMYYVITVFGEIESKNIEGQDKETIELLLDTIVKNKGHIDNMLSKYKEKA